jgi:hypothetical protein
MKEIIIILAILVVLNLLLSLYNLTNLSKNTENYCGCNNGSSTLSSSPLMSYNNSNNSNNGCNISLIGFWQTSNGNGSTLSFLQEGQVISQDPGKAGVLYMYACPENSMYGSIYNKEISVRFLLQDESTLFITDPERGPVEYIKIPTSPSYTSYPTPPYPSNRNIYITPTPYPQYS